METHTEPTIECVSAATETDVAVPESESESAMTAPFSPESPDADESSHDQEMGNDDSDARRKPNPRVDTQRHLSALLHEVPADEMDSQDVNQPQPQYYDDQIDISTAIAAEDSTETHDVSNEPEQVHSTLVQVPLCL